MKAHLVWVPGAGRDHLVKKLMQEFEICSHPDPQRKGVMKNWASAMRCASKDDTEWSLVIQDDMIVLKGFHENIDAALRNSPSPILGLVWVGAAVPDTDAPYGVGPYVVRGGAVAYKKEIIQDLARFATIASMSSYPHDDMAACYWAKWNGITPALVSHTMFASPKVKSLLGHSPYPTGRVTIEHAENLDWTSGKTVKLNATREDEEEFRAEMEALGWTL